MQEGAYAQVEVAKTVPGQTLKCQKQLVFISF